ncbi:unnamed protein product [Lactuca virosa]|uniref:Mitochondrial carrier protein n=1 Tax=Lactuca virosa TaxID=75947 RepID=A0AAU9PDJ3_9ASTR|nr:unnamed protein product [Lactuca virosa]
MLNLQLGIRNVVAIQRHNIRAFEVELERAFAAAGAAFLSAVIVNPLDVAKTRLQAQAASVPYQNLHSTCRFEPNTKYKGTLDVFQKVIHEEGFSRLWRGTNASLALAVPTVGIYMHCYDILRNYMEAYTSQNAPSVTPYVPLVAGSVARSLACVTCYPVELARTRMQAFKDGQHGTKLPGVWKTPVGVVSADTNTTKNLNNNSSSFDSYGRVLGHNYLVMFHFLRFAGLPWNQ